MSDANVTVTLRHTRPTQAAKPYIDQKIFCILSVDAKTRQLAEIEFFAGGTTIHNDDP